MTIETPDEEVGATFIFEGGVAAQTNLAHTKDEIEKTLHDYFRTTLEDPSTKDNIIFFDLSQESEESEGTFILCPNKLLFVRLGKRHVAKRVEPVQGSVVQYPNVRR